jgi:CBS domain-containing protein
MKTLKVKDYMSKDVVTIEIDASIHDAIEKMLEHDIHGLVVVDESNKPVGIISTDDILAVVERGETGQDAIVREFMSMGMLSVDPEYDLHKTLEIMRRNKMHRLPVMKDRKLLGIITSSDILRVYEIKCKK